MKWLVRYHRWRGHLKVQMTRYPPYGDVYATLHVEYYHTLRGRKVVTRVWTELEPVAEAEREGERRVEGL